MPKSRSLIHYIKWFLLAVYVLCFLGVHWYMKSHGLNTREFIRVIHRLILEAGWLGPFAVLLFYFFQTIIPFPTIGLAILSGALYGPWWGSLLALIGLNVSGYISFYLGRFFGRHLVAEHEHGWIKRLDESLRTQGFLTVVLLRILMFPFDFVSLGSGMTTMSVRQYMIGTALGVLPGTLTFVWLGESLQHPRSLRVFVFLFVLVLLAALWLRRSKWAQASLFAEPKKKEEDLIAAD